MIKMTERRMSREIKKKEKSTIIENKNMAHETVKR
jgi:hypothetical protein